MGTASFPKPRSRTSKRSCKWFATSAPDRSARLSSTVIIGGGITGLSAAWSLCRAGRDVTLIEPGPFGGLLRTEHIQGCTVECGSDSWIRAKPWLRDLAKNLGLADQIVPCNDPRRRTFVFRGGKLHPFPRGLRLIAPSEWRPVLASGLIGPRTKWRMLHETLRRPSLLPDRSVADFVLDHFGREALEYLVEPLFAGVYGGSPEQLGAIGVMPKVVEYERTHGSLARGARAEAASAGPLFESMRGGLGQIPQALVQQIQDKARIVRAPADTVEPGRVRVNGEWIAGTRIILACGAPAAASLLSGTAPGALLAGIPHSSATIFAFAFDRGQIARPPEGFGFLVPRLERRAILAATWVTNKFTGRAPIDTLLVRCFAAGDQTESLIPDVLADLRRITGVAAPPLFSRVYRWPSSLPQYGVGHAELIAKIHAALPPGIVLAGAFLNGVGMPDCARSGISAAAAG